jgi:hypothetical protein
MFRAYRATILTGIILTLLAGSRGDAQFLFERQRENLRVGNQLVVNCFEADPDLYETHLVITDVEGSGSVVNVLVYDADGRLADQESYFLPIFGKVNYNPAERLPDRRFRGTIRIFSDGGNIAAQYWQFHKKRGESCFNTAISVSDGEGSPSLLCQHFVSDANIDARLYLTNPSLDSSVTVAVTFYLDRGKQLTRDRYTIAPNASLSINPYEANEQLVRTGLAYCEVLGPGKITGEYWQKHEEERYQVSLPLDAIPRRERDW